MARTRILAWVDPRVSMMSDVVSVAGGRFTPALNGMLSETSAMFAVGDHLDRIAGWQARLRSLSAAIPAHREQIEALRIAIRISRSEFDDIEQALSSRAAAHPRVAEALKGYVVLRESLARI